MLDNKDKIQGGDKVRLKNGKVVTVEDIHNKHVVVSIVEYYSFDDVEEIVEKFNRSK